MIELEDGKKYKSLNVNGVIFNLVQIFILENILENKIEIVDNWSSLTIAFIYTDDIKTIIID